MMERRSPARGIPSGPDEDTMTQANGSGSRFIYDRFTVEPEQAELVCTYRLGTRVFTERIAFVPGGNWGSPAVAEAARIVFLLAGVSYYKTAAPPVIDLGDNPSTADERQILTTFFREGLGEFAYRNDLDLGEVVVQGPDAARRPPAPTELDSDRPLIPFGGGIDSIVTVESVRSRFADSSLFVVSHHGGRFEAIENCAGLIGLPVVRAERRIDPQLMESARLGFLNGHVPVTGIISAIAVMAGVLGGHGAVVMSNEWSASRGNLEVNGHTVNHQWSKGADFEGGFRRLLAGALSPAPEYFSLLRPYSELWVARRFAALDRYHRQFRSCNRVFQLDPALRLDHWCGRCDKCCFIDLILSPYLGPTALAEIFDQAEPLRDRGLANRFLALVGTTATTKPFECVGDVDECREAVLLASERPDRREGLDPLLQSLADAVRADGRVGPSEAQLLAPLGPHFTPDAYAPEDQLV